MSPVRAVRYAPPRDVPARAEELSMLPGIQERRKRAPTAVTRNKDVHEDDLLAIFTRDLTRGRFSLFSVPFPFLFPNRRFRFPKVFTTLALCRYR